MDSQPSTSSMDPKGTKQKTDQSNNLNQMAGSVDNSKNNTGNQYDQYEVDGMITSWHGNVFQMKLFLLFSYHGFKEHFKFQLAIDMKLAEKFDDVVFEYEPKDPSKKFDPKEAIDPSKRSFIFLQAKHRNDTENKNKITIKELQSGDGDFSLQKYFESFCNIKRNARFQGAKSYKFFLVTNTVFYFIRDNTENLSDLFKNWNTFFEVEGDLRDDKILGFTNSNFKAKVYKLRHNFKEELKNITKENNEKYKTNKDNETAFKQIDKYFTDFIDQFRIVINYPKESELEALIKDEFREVFNDVDADFAYAEFQRHIFGLMEIHNGRIAYFNTRKAHDAFDNIETKMVQQKISELCRSYLQLLKEYGMKFNDTIAELDKFLKPENEKQIFQLITESTRLGAIKVLKSLDEKYETSFISMQLETLLRLENEKDGSKKKINIFKCLESKNSYNLVMIEIPNENQEKEKVNFIKFLQNLFKNNMRKKLIVIVSKYQEYKSWGFQTKTKEEHITFKDFDKNSQDKILEREVNFQGNNVQWNQLINNTAAEDVFDQMILSRIIENGKTSIGNQNAFSSIGYVEDCYIERKFRRPIISEDIIKKKPTSMKLFISGADKQVLIEFGVKSDDIEEIKLIDIEKHEDCDFKKYTGKSIIIPPSVRGQKYYNSEYDNLFNNVHWLHRVFIKIFHDLGDNVHWLHYTQSRFFWMNSKNDSMELIEFVQTDDDWENASVGNATLDEIHFAEIKSSVPRTIIDTNVMIFARLATQVRHLQTFKINIELTNQHGLRRPDLNAKNSNLILEIPEEYVQLCLQDFDEGDKAKAKEFLERLATLCDPNDLIAKIEGSVRRTIIVANDAGMGKSTVLTSLATKMRQEDHNNKESTNYRWIVRINLNDYANEEHESCLEKIQFDKDNTIKKTEAIDFVTKMAIPDDPKNDLIEFQRKIFKLSLGESRVDKKTPEIVLMFDGFDEIAPDYRNHSTMLIKALEASQVTQIWVSTRDHELDELQRNLNSLGFVMTPLSYKNQIEFSNNLWKWQLKFKKEFNDGKWGIIGRGSQEILDILMGIKLPNEEYAKQLNECISELVKEFDQNHHQIEMEELRKAIDQLDFSEFFEGMIGHWKQSIKDDDNKFTINPLQLKMLTEVVFAENFQLPQDFELSSLYEKFIETKFDICYTEKGKLIRKNPTAKEARQTDSEVSHKVHEALAVHHFFHKTCEDWKALPNLSELDGFESNGQGKEEKETKRKEMLKFARKGILVLSNDWLDFIHESFAEFFLSKYLIRNARNPKDQKVQELLFKHILVGNNYKLVRNFFNKQLEQTKLRIELGEASMNLINDNLEENEGSFLSLIENGHHKILEQLLAASSNMTERIIEKHILNSDNLSKLIRSGRDDKIVTILRFIKQNEKYIRDGSFEDCITKTCTILKKERIDMENLKNTIRSIFGMDRFKKLFPSDNTYNISGLNLSFHGVEFQKKLIMLFIHRATHIGYEFWLATEMDVAQKFDDVVLEYSKPNDPHKRNFILVNAKHSIDCEKSKITITELKSENDITAFSLQKYFISFCKIKRHAHFRGAESSKYFIVTNTNFDFIGNETQKSNKDSSKKKLIDKWRHFIQQEGNLCDDEFLRFSTSDFKAQVYKLCDNPEGEIKKMMKLNLLDNALNTSKILEFQSASEYLNLIAKQTYSPELDKLKGKLKGLQEGRDRRTAYGRDRRTAYEISKILKEASELYEKIFAGSSSWMVQDINEKMANDDVLRKTDELLKIISGECSRLGNELQKFEMEDSNEYNRLKEERQSLKEDEHKLEEMVHRISNTVNLKEIKILMTEDILTKSVFIKVRRDIQNLSNLDEVKSLLCNKLNYTLENMVRESSVIEVALDKTEFDKDFDEFIKHFRIVTNYPKESELGALIKDELGKDLNLSSADLAYFEFERDATNLLKNSKGGKAEYYDRQMALATLDKIRKQL